MHRGDDGDLTGSLFETVYEVDFDAGDDGASVGTLEGIKAWKIFGSGCIVWQRCCTDDGDEAAEGRDDRWGMHLSCRSDVRMS